METERLARKPSTLVRYDKKGKSKSCTLGHWDKQKKNEKVGCLKKKRDFEKSTIFTGGRTENVLTNKHLNLR